jgi:hypothetical protein
MKQVSFQQTFDFIERAQVPTVDGWERIVTGIVADPENIDSYGNVISEEEIRGAMYRFMENYQHTGLEHIRNPNGDDILFDDKIKILETWQTRDETTINEKTVPKGAWILTVRVIDDDIWTGIVDGTYTGFSFCALATSIPIKAK